MTHGYLDFLAGSFGGAAGVIVGHPFDTVKARLQTQSSDAIAGSKMYNGTIDCFRKIIQQESFAGLYKGVTSPLAGLTLVNAIVFGVYGNCIKLFDQSKVQSHVLAGSIAGACQSIVTSPMEMSKLWIQLQGQGVRHTFFWHPCPTNLYSGPLDSLRKVRKRYGFTGLFKGLGLTVARDASGFAMYFAAYESMNKFIKTRFNREMNPMELLLCGGLAGSISWSFNYPIDVIKTRYQADLSDQRMLYKSVSHCISYSYQREGIRAFLQGLTPTAIRAFPTNAVTFFTVTMVYRVHHRIQTGEGSLLQMNNWDDIPVRVHFVNSEEFIVTYSDTLQKYNV